MNLKFIRNILFIYFAMVSFCFAKVNSDDVRIKNVEEYLNSIKYIESNFIQDDITNSKLSEGMFYLSRSGKLRIDYTNPFEASLYTNKSVTTYYDKELDEITNITTKSTPLHFLLKEKISLADNSISIIKIEEDSKFILVYLKEQEKEEQGTLVLKLIKAPTMELSSIKLINELDQEIEINLFNIKKDPIKNSVFVFKNPRL